MTTSPPRRLLVRVYLYGTLMVALAFGASFVVGSFVVGPLLQNNPGRPATTWIVQHLDRLSASPQEFRKQLEHLKKETTIEITFFDGEGHQLATSAAVPPPPLTQAQLRANEKLPYRYEGVRGYVGLPDESGKVTRYAIVTVPVVSLHYGIPIAQLVVALVVIGLISIPLARSVTAPIEKMVTALRALGQGDFSVRAGVVRGDEFGDMSRAFDEMATRIRETRVSEKELLANVSHELRTPLARIRMALELIEGNKTPESGSYWRDIEEDLVELEQFLDDILTATRSDLAHEGTASSASFETPLRLERVSAQAIIDAARHRFESRVPQRQLVWSAPAELPELDADPRLLRRALDNLLSNAAKFSPAPLPIEMSARWDRQANVLELSVMDRGPGISPENLEHVFEPFFRAKDGTGAPGVGLGLVVVRRIVSAHHGSVDVESTLGVGTSFRIVIPVAAREVA